MTDLDRHRPQPPSSNGVRAHRIADMMERFGVNTFSSDYADSNRWGSWPADYTTDSVVAALKWLTDGSGMTMTIREYHYAGIGWQDQWCSTVHAETDATFTMAIGANGGVADGESLADLASKATGWLVWVEGVNEPNNDFGNGAVATSTVIDAQAPLMGVGGSMWVMGPSVVFGLPYPEGYISPGYFSATEMASVNASMTVCNAHFYPPYECDMPDGSTRGGAFRDLVEGLHVVHGDLPVAITEWHPTLYNARGHSLDPAYDAYYAPCFFLSAFREGIVGWWWYALFDYSTAYLSGLFPKIGGVDPRPVANTIRAMFRLTGDDSEDKHAFTPGRLDFSVKGLPAPPPDAPNMRGQTMLFQNAAGTYFLYVWDAREEPEGDGEMVSVSFAKPAPHCVTRYKISGARPETVLQHDVRPSSVSFRLNGSVHLLVIVV